MAHQALDSLTNTRRIISIMNSTQKIHMSWTIGVLSAIIIGLVSVKWSDIPNLGTIVNFGVGFTSMVLAVIAIFYGFISQNSSTQTLSQINSAATDITKTVAEVPAKLKSMEGSLSVTLTKIDAAANEITKTVSTLPGTLDSIKTSVLETEKSAKAAHEGTKEFGARLAMTAAVQASPSKQDDANPSATLTQELLNKTLDEFLGSISWYGLVVLYMCKFALTNNVKISFSELHETENGITDDYAHGFLVAAGGVGYVTSFRETATSEFEIYDVFPGIQNKIDAAITERLKTHESKEVFNDGWKIVNAYLKTLTGKKHTA